LARRATHGLSVIGDPEVEWNGGGQVPEPIGKWMRERGRSPRLYPGSLIRYLKKPGRELREAIELSLARRRIEREVAEGLLGAEFDRPDSFRGKSKGLAV